MNGSEHYLMAERLIKTADEWLDADWGWKADLSGDERLARRASDVAAAQVHATLAKAPAAPVDLSELRNLVHAFDPTSASDRAQAFKNDLLQVIVGIERGDAS